MTQDRDQGDMHTLQNNTTIMILIWLSSRIPKMWNYIYIYIKLNVKKLHINYQTVRSVPESQSLVNKNKIKDYRTIVTFWNFLTNITILTFFRNTH